MQHKEFRKQHASAKRGERIYAENLLLLLFVSHQKPFRHFLFAFSLVQPNISFILQFEDTVVTTINGYWPVLGVNVSINGVIVLNVR